jgi:carbonic anhydrase
VSTIDGLLENNRAFAQRFEHTPLPQTPAKRLAIVACMDARLDPFQVLGLTPGDAHVIRNAGGMISDREIRSLAISQHVLGTEEIMVIHHTDCGMLGFDGAAFADKLETEVGLRPPWEADGFSDLEQSVRDSVERLKRSPFLPRKGSIRGFVYEVEFGTLREVTGEVVPDPREGP